MHAPLYGVHTAVPLKHADGSFPQPLRSVLCRPLSGVHTVSRPFTEYDTEGRLDNESILILIALTDDVQLTSRDMPVGYLTLSYVWREARLTRRWRFLPCCASL